MFKGLKSLGWILGLGIAYLIAAIPLDLPPFQDKGTKQTVDLSASAANSCDANRREPEISKGNKDEIYYHADGNGPYKVDFDGHYPYKEGSNPITVPSGGKVGPYTAKVAPSANPYLYTLSNGSNCKQVSNDIGVIVKP